ncbi:MAG TPA: DUF3631 domain-containing protein [Terriglobales bacterium]|nr:DUF3631 domain-containing protein [Terriglobales bacterium]
MEASPVKHDSSHRVPPTYEAVREWRRLNMRLERCSTASDLLQAIEDFIGRYTQLPPGIPFVLALYAAFTHCFECFDAIPYLRITSPTRGCGKTRVLELLKLFSARAIMAAAISAAAFYRVIERDKPTLLIDESENLTGRLSEKGKLVLEVSNVGYKRGQTIKRCVGDRYDDIGDFDPFCPKVFALIDIGDSFPPTLADRSIKIKMSRAKRRLPRYRMAVVESAAEPYSTRLAQWAEENRPQIEAWHQSHDIDFLEGRAEEIWLPLFAVCAVMAPDRLAELETIARAMTGEKSANNDDVSIRLLTHIRTVFGAEQDRISSSDLCKLLNQHEELRYQHWNNHNGISQSDLANRLAPFGIHSQQLRFGGSNLKGYKREDFAEAWATYLPSKGGTPVTPIGECV